MDGQVVRLEKGLKELSTHFGNVRIVKCNGLDLSLFQFDSDWTFAAFFLNSDRAIYARYGTRGRRRDVAIEGLAATMRRVLEIQADYPSNGFADGIAIIEYAIREKKLGERMTFRLRRGRKSFEATVVLQ